MPVSFDTQTILLVDDENFSRSLVGQMLRRIGFAEVILAEDGHQAMSLLDQIPNITAILTDFRMPGMHGLQLLKAVRTGRTSAARNLPCAMLTSHAERNLVNLAIVLDVDTFLAKPASLETLAKHLNRCFQYRFEPLPVEDYEAVDVDNAAPHLSFNPPARKSEQPEAEEVPETAPPKTAQAPSTKKGPVEKTVPKTAKAKETTRADRAPPPSKRPTASAAKPGTATKAAKPREATTDSRPAVQVAIADVPENAILARDVIGANGTLLLAAGTPFKARYAKRIEELSHIEGTIERVWILEA